MEGTWTFEYQGVSYELKMTRAGARVAERAGFALDDALGKPSLLLLYLFYAALYHANKTLTWTEAEKMLDHCLDTLGWSTAALLEWLTQEYDRLFK